MEKLKPWIYKNRFIIGYSCAAAIFLVLLNTWIWPTPDEYLYATLARTITAGFRGEVSLSNTNTEHVALLSAIGALYQAIIPTSSLAEGRVFMVLFGLATIWLFYAIAKKIVIKPEQRSWVLWLLLLIPGFWIFSVRFMLDIPATLAIGVIVYLLLTKKPALIVSMGLVLLLLFKEYFIYLIVPMCAVVYACDALHSKEGWWRAGLQWLGRCIIICIPIILVTILLIDFQWLPYPRLLENGLAFIFKNNFLTLNEQIVHLLDNFVQLYDPTISFFTPYATSPIAPDTGQTMLTVPVADQSLLASDYTQMVTNSPANIIQGEWLAKLWHIYSYNFSETDLSVFVLPLGLLGFVVRCQAIWHGWKKDYATIRVDIVFATLLAVFGYLNYHEANSLIGFRITLPIIFPLIYFAYHGAQILLNKPLLWQRGLFMLGMVVTVLAYWWMTKDSSYGSVLANTSALSTLIAYKPYLFIGMFIAITVGILIYPQLRWRGKPWLLVLAILAIFTLKFIPIYIDDRVSENLYGDDYGVAGATVELEPLMQQCTRLCSNAHFYKSQYYANDPRIGNEEINPQMRVFTKRYVYRYATCPFNDEFLSYIKAQHIQYVLVVNDDFDDADYKSWLRVQAQQPELFTLVANQELHGRVQWALYKVNP